MRIIHWNSLAVGISFVALSLLPSSGAAQAVASQATSHRVLNHAFDKTKITEVLTAQQAAWNRGDVDAFIVGYWESPQLTFSGSSGIARGFAGVRERYHRNYQDRASMGELAFSDLEFRFLGQDSALVLGHWHLKRPEKGDVGGVFSLVWQRFRDGWKIVHDHTSSVDGM